MKDQDTDTPQPERQIPLVVDLDGTLLRTDTLWEGARSACLHAPLRFAGWLGKLLLNGLRRNGDARLAFKWELSPWTVQGVPTYPINKEVYALLQQAVDDGRPVCLATASPLPVAEEVAGRIGLFSAVFASTKDRNLIGGEKAKLLTDTYGQKGFDYIGDSRHDIPVWANARHAMIAGGQPALAKKYHLEQISKDTPHSGLRVLARALRLHQWVKNLLVFVPMLAAHAFTLRAFGESLLAFLALSLCASAIYMVNDVFDLEDDRSHPKKSLRPLASGTLPLIYAPLCFCGCVLAAFLCGAFLSSRFMGFLLLYLCCSTAYSMLLKKMEILDILMLAGLYVLRIIMGIAAIKCEFSQWLFFFFFFLFLGLATIKRLGALGKDMPEEANSRRGWKREDKAFLLPLAVACGVGAGIIFWIYCTSDQAMAHYRNSDYLILINIIFIYWYQKIVLLVNRGVIRDDPLEYAMKEIRNYPLYLGVIALFCLSLWC